MQLCQISEKKKMIKSEKKNEFERSELKQTNKSRGSGFKIYRIRRCKKKNNPWPDPAGKVYRHITLLLNVYGAFFIHFIPNKSLYEKRLRSSKIPGSGSANSNSDLKNLLFFTTVPPSYQSIRIQMFLGAGSFCRPGTGLGICWWSKSG